MPIQYNKIPGWFHASELYDMVVEKHKHDDNVAFVEIGSYFGRSSCYMMELIKERDPSIHLDIIDPWIWNEFFTDINDRVQVERIYRSDEMNAEHRRVVEEVGKDPYKIFHHYLDPTELLCSDNIDIIQDTSEHSIVRYDDKSLDFVYIDGDHSFDVVRRDIELYMPKIKDGGIISGDDYNCVGPLVDSILGDVTIIDTKTWMKIL